MGTFPEGVERLKKLSESQNGGEDSELASYVQFRLMTAEFYLAQQDSENIATVQEKWLKDLEAFVTANPKSSDSADAMMQLAMAEEFAGNDNKALRWYEEIVTNFPNAPSVAMAKGARTRLSSVGKPITVAGKKFNGQGTASLANYKDKAVVLVHYWSSEYDVCKAEIPQLIDMQAKYAKGGFAILSVCLDRDPRTLQQYLAGKKLPWDLIYEPGGFNSRLAVEMGINTAPTMLLVDKTGRVINRSIHTAELDSELQKLLAPQPRQANRPIR
jgi:thiol-disulfide isomerase/thioredoxin